MLVCGFDLGNACRPECASDALLLLLSHLRKEWQNDSGILSLFALETWPEAHQYCSSRKQDVRAVCVNSGDGGCNILLKIPKD